MTRLEFSATTKRKAFDRAMMQGGKCQCGCGQDLQPPRIAYDHILPDALGGKPELANCQVLNAACHQRKTSTEDVPRIRKADRQKVASINAKPSPKQPIQSRGFDRKQRAPKPALPPRQFYKDASA